MLSHNTTGAPWPRNSTQVCSSISRMNQTESHWQTLSKRGRERGWVERWNEPRKYISPASCLPFTLPSHKRLALCGFTDAEMSQGLVHLIWHQKARIKTTEYTALFQICSWDRVLVQFELKHRSHYWRSLSTQCYKLHAALRTASATKRR